MNIVPLRYEFVILHNYTHRTLYFAVKVKNIFLFMLIFSNKKTFVLNAPKFLGTTVKFLSSTHTFTVVFPPSNATLSLAIPSLSARCLFRP